MIYTFILRLMLELKSCWPISRTFEPSETLESTEYRNLIHYPVAMDVIQQRLNRSKGDNKVRLNLYLCYSKLLRNIITLYVISFTFLNIYHVSIVFFNVLLYLISAFLVIRMQVRNIFLVHPSCTNFPQLIRYTIYRQLFLFFIQYMNLEIIR